MSPSAPHLAGAAVLVVEDNFIVAMDLEEQLRALGVVVLGPFGTVDEARAAGERTPPALAVLDVHVRGGSTVPLAGELAARGIPCVFVTGYAEIPGLPEALARVPRLKKPVVPGELRAALERLLAVR